MIMPWRYITSGMSAQDAPYTHALFLECIDGQHNYRGIKIGTYIGFDAAKQAAEADSKTRTDWRTATEQDEEERRAEIEKLTTY